MNSKHSTDGLVGKVAMITGAAHRIGAVIARTLHGEGMNLVLHYRHSQAAAAALRNELEAHRPGSVQLVQADLHQTAQLGGLVQAAVECWGRLDLLVNNASSFYPTPVAGVDEAQWNDLIGSNLKTPFFLSQAAAPYLAEQGGSIVNIVDIHAERPLKGYPVYSIAKAGLVMLTKALACELGPEMRVNAVAPGAILWPEHEMDEATRDRIVSRTFLKRQGHPLDIARAVVYLARDAGYVTGQVITVDGGRSLNS